MGEILLGLVLIAGLAGILLFILGGMRSGHGAAKSLRGLNRYHNPQPWAAATLSGLAIAVIADTLSAPTEFYTALALAVGLACGWDAEGRTIIGKTVGLVGALGAVCASYLFVANSGPGLWLNLALAIGLAAVFVLLGVFRRRPHDGLAWFAGVEILVFMLSPFGGSLLDLAAPAAYTVVGLAIAAIVLLALTPTAVLTLAAAAVALAAPTLSLMGWSGDLGMQITYIILALLTCLPVALLRRRAMVG